METRTATSLVLLMLTSWLYQLDILPQLSKISRHIGVIVLDFPLPPEAIFFKWQRSASGGD